MTSATRAHGRKRLVRRLAVLLTLLVAAAAGSLYWWEYYRPLPSPRDVNRLIAANRLKEAESACRASLRRNPRDGRTRIVLARVLGAQGRTADAAEQLRAVPDGSTKKLDALFYEGQAWILTNHARNAEAAWLAYLDHQPDPNEGKPFEGRVETDLINLYSVEDRWDETRAIIWRSYDRLSNPEGKRALTLMALRTRLGRFTPARAIETLRQYVAADPGDLQAQLAIARLAQTAGLTDDADAALAACRERYSTDPSYLKTRFQVLAARGDGPELEAMLAKPPKSLETLPVYWRTLGNRAFRQKRWADSARHYRRALALEPDDLESTYRLALNERHLGHRAEAQVFQKRHRDLGQARDGMASAYNAIVDATSDPPPPGSPTVAEAARRLAELCRVMRWQRQADAWQRIANSET